ncbi:MULTISPECIES: TIGR02117 family protein [unclassified Sphingomonas]|uniref:TIGR02117 family protein n=1 Tax=unclassified Sphingomonas TaxID=196159 RepID=UPI00226A3672|nr:MULTISPECIES: TIGR02117 family protein [unclassified Sphingomonas]
MTRYATILRAALRRTALALAVLACGYALLGLAGGAIPANRGWTPPSNGVRIFVESNGIHVGLVVPKVAAGVDWRGWAPARDLADPRYAGYDHLAIGWGEQDFFLGTPRWSDVRPGTIIAAATGSDRTLIHLEHVPVPEAGGTVRAIVLRPAEYRRLAAYVQASFAPGGARYRGYDMNDAFYQARGHYDALRTCNAWTGDALRHAGVRVGWWTPFPLGVMAWF